MAKKKSSAKKKKQVSTEIFHKNDHIMNNYQGESCCQVKNFKLITDLIPDLENFYFPKQLEKSLDIEILRFKNILINEDYLTGDAEDFEGYLSEDTEYVHTCENNNEKIGELPIEELIKVHQEICDGKINPSKLTSYQYFKVMMYTKPAKKEKKTIVGPKSFKEKIIKKAVRKSPRSKNDDIISIPESEPDIEPVRYLRKTRSSTKRQEITEPEPVSVSPRVTRSQKRKVPKTPEIKENPVETPKLADVDPKENEKPPIPDSPESPDNLPQEDKPEASTESQVKPVENPNAPVTSVDSEVDNTSVNSEVDNTSVNSEVDNVNSEVDTTSVSPIQVCAEVTESPIIPAIPVKCPEVNASITPPIAPKTVERAEIPDKPAASPVNTVKASITEVSTPKLVKQVKESQNKEDEKENVCSDDEQPVITPLIRKLAQRDPRLQKRIEEQKIFETKKSVADRVLEDYRKKKLIRDQIESKRLKEELERQRKELERQKQELKRKEEEAKRKFEEELKEKIEEELRKKEEEQKKKKRKTMDMDFMYKTPLSDLHSEEKITYYSHKAPRSEDYKSKDEDRVPHQYYSNISYNTHHEHVQPVHQQIHFHIHAQPREYHDYNHTAERKEPEVQTYESDRNRYYEKPFRRRYEYFHRRDRYRTPEKRYSQDNYFRRRSSKDDRRY